MQGNFMQDDTQNQVPGATPPSQPPIPPSFGAMPPAATPESTPAPVAPAPQPFSQPVPQQPMFQEPVPQQPIPQPFAPQPQPSFDQGPAYEPPKSKKPLFIILAIIGALLIAGAIAFVLLMPKGGSNEASTTQPDSGTAVTVPADEKPSVEASKILDLSQVCDGKKITNAPEFSASKKVRVFEGTSPDWTPVIFLDDENVAKTVDEAGAVGCVVRDTSSETAAKKCSILNPTTKGQQNVDYIGATYDVTIYDAHSGEKLTETKQLVASNETCPGYAFKDGIQYATPDQQELVAIFDAFFEAK